MREACRRVGTEPARSTSAWSRRWTDRINFLTDKQDEPREHPPQFIGERPQSYALNPFKCAVIGLFFVNTRQGLLQNREQRAVWGVPYLCWKVPTHPMGVQSVISVPSQYRRSVCAA